MKKCSKCGFEADEKFCPNCGIEMSDVNESEQSGLNPNDSGMAPEGQVNNVQRDSFQNTGGINSEMNSNSVIGGNINTNASKKSLSKKMIIILSIIAVLVIAASVTIGIIVHKNNLEQEYAKNLNMFTTEVLYGAQDSESQCNLVMSVWHDAIWNDTSDEETKKYVVGAKDFNDALTKLYADKDFQSKTSDINSNKDTVDSLMEKLKNPPEKYKDCYNVAVELYSKYNSFVNMAVDPSGSYNSYSENVQDLDSEVADLYSKLNTMLPSVD